MEIQRFKKINTVLEKKLAELESLLEAITFSDHDDPKIYRKMELGVVFAQTLLAAEISSRPLDVEGEEDSEEMLKLRFMAKRLTEIEAFISNHQLNGYDNGLLIEPEIEEVNDGETGSVYSWTESCLNESSIVDEGHEEENEVEDEQWLLFQDALTEENGEVLFPEVAAVEEEVVVVVDREVKKRRVGFKVLVYFGLIGLVGGMISLFGFVGDNLKDDTFYLSPT